MAGSCCTAVQYNIQKRDPTDSILITNLSIQIAKPIADDNADLHVQLAAILMEVNAVERLILIGEVNAAVFPLFFFGMPTSIALVNITHSVYNNKRLWTQFANVWHVQLQNTSPSLVYLGFNRNIESFECSEEYAIDNAMMEDIKLNYKLRLVKIDKWTGDSVVFFTKAPMEKAVLWHGNNYIVIYGENSVGITVTDPQQIREEKELVPALITDVHTDYFTIEMGSTDFESVYIDTIWGLLAKVHYQNSKTLRLLYMKARTGTVLDFIAEMCIAYLFPYGIEKLEFTTEITGPANEQCAKIKNLINLFRTHSTLIILYLVISNVDENSCNEIKNAFLDDDTGFRVLVIRVHESESVASSPTTQSSGTSTAYRDFTNAANNIKNNNLRKIEVVEEGSDCESECESINEM